MIKLNYSHWSSLLSFLVNSRCPSLVHFSKKDLERLLRNTLCFDSELTRHSFSLAWYSSILFESRDVEAERARYSPKLLCNTRFEGLSIIKTSLFHFPLVIFLFSCLVFFFLASFKVASKSPNNSPLHDSVCWANTRYEHDVNKHDLKKGTVLRAIRTKMFMKWNNKQNPKLMV